MQKNKRLPRGLRNNNPLNLIKSAKPWVGEIAGKDTRFCTFSSMAYGYRAAFKTLDTYSRWAPESDGNDTRAYIKFVCERMGVEPTHTIVFNAAYQDDIAEAKEMVKWMAYLEQGVNADIDLKALEEGYALAFGK